MADVIRTQRLILTPVTQTDIADLHRHWNAPAVRRFLWDDETMPIETVTSTVDSSERDFKEFRYGLWSLRLAADQPLIGFCGLQRVESTDLVEVLYSLDQTYWGRGLAGEAARAVLTFGFNVLGLARIAGGTDEGNLASIRVLERLGMRFVDNLMLHGQPRPYYAVDRAAFEHV